LVGDCLIGAVIVGVGLPPVSVERELVREYFEAKAGAGFEYAYLYPGMNRVLQASGRVIRSEADQGTVLLIDNRFSQARYRRLFPSHWQPQVIRTPAQLRQILTEFWNRCALRRKLRSVTLA